ncbi:MAG: glutamate-5-semialdehyde dehydrogenase [Candidatus Omnitrophica bacterium]|nr:glutamate-5-semialdehyde dehydrogenase [Candidatus Omnitrophota bacterium]
MSAKLKDRVRKIAEKAKAASSVLAQLSVSDKNNALLAIAGAILTHQDAIIKANNKDLAQAKKEKYPAALVDRLALDEKRIIAMAEGLKDTAALRDPIGEILDTTERPNGLLIKKIRVPIGVVAIIFESRPNVTADCIALCLKSGNAVILKGGKEAAYSNDAIFKVCRKALKDTAIPAEAVQMVPSKDRKAVDALLKLDDLVDLVIPRGGEGLIRFVAENSSIPVIKHFKGVCHIYVSDQADLAMAEEVCFNAKVQRPGTCNAMEKMLVHKDVADKFLRSMLHRFTDAGVELRGDAKTRQISKKVKPASKEDWTTEYLDLILTVKIVGSLDEAIGHINTFGSHHSDAIITKSEEEIEKFFKSIDSACVYSNASTRFTDGYEFGFGAEVGISTDKIHARGPMGLEGLTTYKYIVSGNGQIRQ